MTEPAGVTMAERIRWQADALGSGEADGFVGIIESSAFAIWKPPQAGGEWVLTSNLPGQENDRSFDANPDKLKLKAEAERWLERFVSSLGASFEDPAEVAELRKRLAAVESRLAQTSGEVAW